MKIRITKVPRDPNIEAYGGLLETKNQNTGNYSFFPGTSLYELGGTLQAAGSNWGRATVVEEGGTHELNPYEGVQVGVDPEGTPNLVEEGEVIWNDYVFSNRITVPKEVCKRLRIGQKKNGFTFAEAAKKLLVESKERPNDPISKNGLDANMQILEDAQEEVKQKMEAEQAVEQFNNLPPEEQVAIMNQEGERALDAVAQELMAQEFNNLPPEQLQAIAQQMAMEQAQAQGMPQGQPSPEEQAMMQQLMAQQQMPQSGINPEEALAQAAAMQQQAINGSAYGGKLCFGGRKFAEGGMIPQDEMTTEEQYQQGEQPVEQPDNEMAKYSDEELQDMIDDYQEAESGEVKVTKGKLARLRKKAEKAQAELERRHSQENEEQPQEARQEPSQEEIQAAAQALAQQQMMEGQPEGMPLEGVSPEQAMMMQQQMGGQQMSPEQMSAAELQQQGEQYACGGRLYPDGGPLGSYSPYFQGMTVDDILGQIYDNLPSDQKKEMSRKQFIENGRNFTADDWSLYDNQLLQAYYSIHPEAKYVNWKFNNADRLHRTYDNVNFGNAQSVKNNKGNKTVNKEYFVNDPVYKKLSETDRNLEGNKFGEALEAIQEYKDYTDYLVNNWDSPYVRNWLGDMATRNSIAANNLVENVNGEWQYKKDLSSSAIQKAIRKNREDATPASANGAAGNAAGLFHFTANPSVNWTNRYWVQQPDGTYSEVIGGINENDANKYIDINPNNRYEVSDDNGNYRNFFYRPKTDAEYANNIANDEEGNYLTVGWKPKTNWTDYTLGMLPGLTGLTFLIAQGKPDTSGLDAAAAFADRYAGIMAPPHLTHGLMTPAIIDPRITRNTTNASRLGVNRMLRNTGSAPSQAASILANDTNYQHQMGQNDLRDWLANREQEQKAAAFNRETATTNANILNQTDQFNAQMMANAGERAAQMRYNAELEKLNQNNAYRAGLLGNIGSMMTGLYNAYREDQNRNERDLLAASGVFGETNGLLDEYYGISKVDPKTGIVVRGPHKGEYWYNNDFHSRPPMAISAKGGKLKRKNKRKGFTF